jgi:hypothetical protein
MAGPFYHPDILARIIIGVHGDDIGNKDEHAMDDDITMRMPICHQDHSRFGATPPAGSKRSGPLLSGWSLIPRIWTC